jgi:hypothetical protein
MRGDVNRNRLHEAVCRTHPLGQKGNEEIVKKLHTPQITEFIGKHRRNWKENVGRMSADGAAEGF